MGTERRTVQGAPVKRKKARYCTAPCSKFRSSPATALLAATAAAARHKVTGGARLKFRLVSAIPVTTHASAMPCASVGRSPRKTMP